MKQLTGIGCWFLLAAFAPEPRLPYDLSDVWSEDGETMVAAAPPPAPAPAAARGPAPKVVAALTIDMGAIADSNINNATDLPFVMLSTEGGSVPVPLPPESRRRSGIGASASSAASLDLRLSDQAVLAADAEASIVDQRGGANDDAALLAALGPELNLGGSSLVSLQALVFRRWYGGITLSDGMGVRGSAQIPAGKGRLLRFLVEGRWFDSDYGPELAGEMVSASATLEALLTPTMTGAATLYARRQSLGSPAYSSTELGLHGGFSRYFGSRLAASLSLGVSRAAFDAPQTWVSSDPHRDWRFHASLSARTRHPLLLSLHPNLTYTFGRTASSLEFYSADRHTLRVGFDTTF